MKTDLPTSKSGKTAIRVAQDVSLKAGEMLRKSFGQVQNISHKGRGNIVTEMDTEVEAAMFAMLGREFPDMALVGEESSGGQVSEDGYVWVVDPIDGTRNYASGIPFFSIVAGLALDGEPVLGVNYDPMLDEMFIAERGQGAFLNGKQIWVSERTALDQSILGMDLSYNNEGAINGLEVITTIWPGMQTARIKGSSALGISYAAAGRTDLYFHHQLAPWDQVAGLVLVEEAGGIITDRTGKRAGLNSDGLIASNRTLHREFMQKTEGLAWRRPTHLTA
jgi:fructose-1,6-bisphosphatase/inositol monophosphatase family enzyme